MPELGRIDRRAAASLAGCAPHPRDSGMTRGRRTVWGGRASLKRALFIARVGHTNHDPAMRAFYERLVHNGKPKMVAIVAVMRKIVVIANAKVRTIDRLPTGSQALPAGIEAGRQLRAIGRSEERPSIDGLWRPSNPGPPQLPYDIWITSLHSR